MSAFLPLLFAKWNSSIDRRKFLGGAAAAAATLATLPASRAWADTKGGTIPDALNAVGGSGKPVTLTAADLKDFRASLRGQLLLAQDAGYDQFRRVWNGAFDRHPALIARCENATDVARAVGFARSHALLTAVKGGGHSITAQSSCDGGLMIDLSLMKTAQIDQTKRIANVQPGVLLAELDAKTEAVGLVTPLGTAADTGVAGLTLGGGQGRLMRLHGLSCDNVRAYRLVTADGRQLKVSADENPDLYWALRGGGGNFGVVTDFEYQLHAFGHPVLAGTKLYPFDSTRAAFTALVELGSNAPDELYMSGGIAVVAPGSPVPPGKYAAIEVVYSGAQPNEGEKLIAPFAKLGKPVMDTVTAKPYTVAQLGPTGAAPPALPQGLGFYVKSGFLDSVPDALITEIIHASENAPEWFNSIGLGMLAGATARIKPDATAYWNRGSQWDLILAGVWSDHSQDQRNAAVLRDLWKAFDPFTKNYYVNTEPSADEKRLRETYGDNYPRLVELKNKYDPTNLFRLNANIRPTAKA
jgi:FAD/FMN-containing dehydrogenase